MKWKCFISTHVKWQKQHEFTMGIISIIFLLNTLLCFFLVILYNLCYLYLYIDAPVALIYEQDWTAPVYKMWYNVAIAILLFYICIWIDTVSEDHVGDRKQMTTMLKDLWLCCQGGAVKWHYSCWTSGSPWVKNALLISTLVEGATTDKLTIQTSCLCLFFPSGLRKQERLQLFPWPR